MARHLARAALAAERAWRLEKKPAALVGDADDKIDDLDAGAGARFILAQVGAALSTYALPSWARRLLAEQADKILGASAANAVRILVGAGADPSAVRSRLGLRPEDESPTGTGAATLAEQWIEEGLELIKGYHREAYDGVARAIEKTMKAGGRWGAVSEAIRARTNMTKRHAKLVARDQANKLQGRIDKHYQTEAGVKSYRWRTARDRRVRERHSELEGTVWPVNGPGAPNAGPYGEPAHPGEAIQCRCYREPIVDDVPGLSRPGLR